MISLFLALSSSFNSTECTVLYSDYCDICITHFADRQCGYCGSSKTCLSYDERSKCTGTFYYGPEATCDASYVFTPTPTPLPEPSQIPDQCYLYNDCEECTIHVSDRNCGWCLAADGTGKCVNATGYNCSGSLYFNGNAKCGQPTPTPTPTPWPHYTSNTSYCRLLTDSWCEKCVSSDPTMQCVWCYDTHECAMGDEQGFFFGTCKNFAYTNDTKCRGVVSNSAIIGIRVGLAIFVALMIIIGVIICYKVIKQPPESQPLFEQIH